jgi:hypothetical protein
MNSFVRGSAPAKGAIVKTSRGLSSLARCACAVAALAASPAHALDPSGTPAPVTGNATWFTALGSPYGGCGLPQSALDSQAFVALNVYNTPGDYTFYTRPLSGANLAKMGMWNNGHNCGRWVRVTIGDDCTGVNDGLKNKAFCRNGAWASDAYNGATLDMVVGDSCGDDNAWCRDDPFHLDLAQGALNLFQRSGVAVGDLYPAHWNNRHITWQFIPAPGYTGDITIGFLQGAMTWWGAIAVTHLPNGIHGVEYLQDGTWTAAEMNGDMGQSFIVKPLQPGGTDFQIRVRDASDALVFDGRTYSFSLPTSCGAQCSTAFTPVSYTTSTGPSAGNTLTVTRAGAGSGTVTSTPAGISCGSTCAASFTSGAVVTLTATVASGSTFSGWSGACSGTATCVVTLGAARSVTATFDLPTTSGPCTGAVTFTGTTGNFGTAGAGCYRTRQAVNGWGCSCFDGRTVRVNGGTASSTCGTGPFPLAKSSDGYTYFTISAGSFPWASLYVW